MSMTSPAARDNHVNGQAAAAAAAVDFQRDQVTQSVSFLPLSCSLLCKTQLHTADATQRRRRRVITQSGKFSGHPCIRRIARSSLR